MLGVREMPEKLTRVQQYKMKKRKEKRRKQIRALLIAVIISAVLLILAVTSLTCTGSEYKEVSYVVCEGDTLWKLYRENCSGVKWDAWLRDMLTANELGNDPVLMTGECITLLVTE